MVKLSMGAQWKRRKGFDLRTMVAVSKLFLEHLKLLVNLCQRESHTIRVTGSQGMSLRLKHRWRGHLRTVEGGGERNGAGQRYSREACLCLGFHWPVWCALHAGTGVGGLVAVRGSNRWRIGWM